MKKITLITLVILPFFIGCKKSPSNSLSSDKEIYSFVLPFPSPTPWVAGVINNDTITVKVPVGVSLVSITPSIQYYGASISPAIGTAVNFTSPVTYTITAEDGSTRRQVVVVTYKSNTKQITDFRFRPSENPGLASELVGQVVNDSSIVVQGPVSLNLNSLVPIITHNGASINPAGGQAANFSDLVYYTVTAEDGSSKKYNVLVTSNNTVYISSANGNLYALNAVNGQVKWSFNGGAQMGNPICYQGKVYVAVSGGPLYCLIAETGAVSWSYTVPSTGFGTPCVFNGVVYVPYAQSSPFGTGLSAINANTGTLIWSKNVGAGPAFRSVSTPTAVAGYVVVTELGSGVHVLNASDGSLVWNYNTGIIRANPLVTGGVVYVGGENCLLRAFNLTNGNILWQNTTVVNTNSSPVMANDVIYVGGGLKMYALNKTNGSVIWSEISWGGYYGIGDPSHSSVGRFSSASVSLADNALYTGSDDDATYCFDLTTGAKKWTYPNTIQIKDAVPNAVAVNGMVLVNRDDNSLYAFSTKRGTLIWKFTASGPVNTDPCVSDVGGNVFYTGNSGNNN